MKKFLIALIGGTVLAFGTALLVLPGPGLPIIAVGLAILATEFLWARRAWRRTKGTLARARRQTGLRAWLRRRKDRLRHPARRAECGDRGLAGDTPSSRICA